MENLAKLTSLRSEYYIEFPSLEEFTIKSCPKLKTFIFDDMNCSFRTYKKLEVSGCPSLKNLFSASIVAKEWPVRFRFPNLTSLELHKLPELRNFYPGKHTVEWPVLKTLNLCDCGMHDTDEESQMQQPLFLAEEV
ncbi:hypothetical protein ACOSQ3_013929 [Xanthoceras sorbifolium]